MTSMKIVPPQLEVYFSSPSESSQILITSVLGATSNWLVLRFLSQTLGPEDQELEGSASVLLVSFVQDGQFWQEAAQRLGLDIKRLQQTKQYSFVDGLNSIFLPEKLSGGRIESQTSYSPNHQQVFNDIRAALRALKEGNNRKIFLILDGIDIFLAAANDINSVTLERLVLDLREEVYATVLSISADLPLVTRLQTPLERNHAAFLMSMAHQSSLIMSLRMLNTGTAKDVSGVLRITCRDQDEKQRKHQDKELLYFIAGDGKARLFERGQ